MRFFSTNLSAQLRGDSFAEVQYFFRLQLRADDGTKDFLTLAMLSDFTPPDPVIVKKTHGVLMTCQYQGDRSRRVVDAKEILTVVGMCPMRPRPYERDHPDAARLYSNRYFVAQKLGFDMSWIGRTEDPTVDDGVDS